jgi:hypothetical protein
MPVDLSLLLSWPLLACFIAWPALAAAHRRRVSRDASAIALELAAFADAVRAAERHQPLDDTLNLRLHRLRIADASPLQLAQQLERAGPVALADTAQRLALRLRRRVAFERKMLARTAPGLRRGAIAASLPPLLVIALGLGGAHIPSAAQLVLFAFEGAGCLLLWRLARVEI